MAAVIGRAATRVMSALAPSSDAHKMALRRLGFAAPVPSLFSSMSPLVAAVLAAWFLREHITIATVVAILVAFGGLLVMINGTSAPGSPNSSLGNASALLSAVGFGGYAVCLRTSKVRDWSAVLPGYASMAIVLCTIVTLAHGKSLAPLLRGEVMSVREHALAGVWGREVQLVDGETKYSRAPSGDYLITTEISSRIGWLLPVSLTVPITSNFIGNAPGLLDTMFATL